MGKILIGQMSITIGGIGSLLSKESALESFPNLKNFRKGQIYGYQRCFNLVSIYMFQKKAVTKEILESKQLASLSAIKSSQDSKLLVTIFEIPENEWEIFFEREHRYKHELVPFIDELNNSGKCILCIENTDEEYKKRCKTESEYYERVGKYWNGKLWVQGSDEMIYPNQRYMKFCLLAAKLMGEDYQNNFLDTSFLSDRKTSLRESLWSSKKWTEEFNIDFWVSWINFNFTFLSK